MSAARFPNLEGAACIGTEASPKVCERCPARPDCLTWVLEHEQPGFWAGYDVSGRRQLRREFGIALDGADG